MKSLCTDFRLSNFQSSGSVCRAMADSIRPRRPSLQPIAAGIHRARRYLGLTQSDAAERLDISVDFYAMIERGQSRPSIPKFRQICVVLQVSADELLGRVAPSIDPATGHYIPSRLLAPHDDSPELRRLLRRLRRTPLRYLQVIWLLIPNVDRIARPVPITPSDPPARPE